MQTVDMDEAASHLEKLVQDAAHGEPFLITKQGKALLKVEGIVELERPKSQKRVFGTLAGQFSIPDDFDTMFAEEIQAMFEGDGKL